MSAKAEGGASEWIDPDDAPELDDAFFDHGVYEVAGQPAALPRKLGRPKSEQPKVHTGLRLDADVVEHFKSSGPVNRRGSLTPFRG